MAEEDLIFGKNRHMFGGIEPSNMLEFNVTRNLSNKIEITATLPNETIVDGQLLCTVGGAVIRRKTSGYPVDEFDGDLVAKITESGTIIDSTGNPNTQYFYAAFPFSTQGVYNRSYANRKAYKYANVTYYFGFDIDTTDSNPSTRVTYPSDVMNAKYTPAKMNPATDTFEYGSWPSTPGQTFMPRPCIVTINQSTKKTHISYYLNPNDYSKSINGTSIPNHGSQSDYDKYMVEWPKIYTHRELVNGIYKFRCCDKPLDDDWDCICNYDADGNQIDNFYTAAYQGIYAYSGHNPTVTDRNRVPSVWINTIRDTYGHDWNPSVLADRLLIQDLLVMMAKTTNLGEAYHCLENTNSVGKNGIFDQKGMFYGNSDGTYVKVFGMEHFWSNTHEQLLLGLIIDGKDNLKIKFTSSTHDGTSATDYNLTGIGYSLISHLSNTIGGPNSTAYISNMLVCPYGRIPIEGNGSLSTYECTDFSYVTSDGAGYTRLAYCGKGRFPTPFSIKLLSKPDNPIWDGQITLSYKPKEGNHVVS